VRDGANQRQSVLAGAFIAKATQVRIDLHGYRPSEIVWNGLLVTIVQQCWEMGETELQLVHGHGRARGKTPGFVNTNTGRLGLAIRRILRHKRQVRKWIKYSTLDCRKWGVTSVKLKRNPAPTRTCLDANLLPARTRLDADAAADRSELAQLISP
jgi:hypothetical protein